MYSSSFKSVLLSFATSSALSLYLICMEITECHSWVLLRMFGPRGADDNAEGMVSGAASAMRGALACSDLPSVWVFVLLRSPGVGSRVARR